MANSTIVSIIKSSLLTAFSIAAALIWKDVIIEFIEVFLPGDALFYKFLAAIIATLFVVLGIYLILKTEDEAKRLLRNWNRKRL